MRTKLFSLLLVLCFALPILAHGEGLLPSLTDTIGIAMPSIGDTLHRYPDKEEQESNGNVIETFENVSEEDFNSFSEYLAEKQATLDDYKVNGDSFEATIVMNGSSIIFEYNNKDKVARIIYQQGTYDERLENARTRLESFVTLFNTGKMEEAQEELLCIADASTYAPLIDFLREKNYASIDEYTNDAVYLAGLSLLRSGDIEGAISKWKEIQNEESVEKLNAKVYSIARDLVDQNKIISALLLLRNIDEEKCNNLRARIERFLCSLYVPYHDTQYILRPDTMVVNFSGNSVDQNVVKMGFHLALVTLKNNGTVISRVNRSEWDSIDNDKWNDIIDIQCGLFVYAGLKGNGTVVAEWKHDGEKYESAVEMWTNVIQIAVCRDSLVFGLQSDGSVVEAGENGKGKTKGWENIVEIVSDGYDLYGLKSDGTILSTLDNNENELTWASVLYSSAEALAQVNSDGTTQVSRMNTEKRKLWGDVLADNFAYLHNATNCLALPRFDNTFGIIKTDGTLVLLTGRDGKSYVSESSWRLWEDETEMGELFKQQYDAKWIDVGESNPTMPSDIETVGNHDLSEQNRAVLEDLTFQLGEIMSQMTSNDAYPVLGIGSKGDDVKRLQQALIDGGFLHDSADGDFGNKTVEAVTKAQEAYDMPQTGVADDAFQKRLYGESN